MSDLVEVFERRLAGGVLTPSAVAWGVYDFAYSLFSFLLLVRFFPTWIINDLDRPDWYVTVTQLGVVVFVLLAMPVAGALADQLGQRRPFLGTFTLVAALAAVVLTLLPVGGSVLPLLVVAGVAAAFGQLALAQYDPLLADVAPEGARGRVSGFAVTLGFVGIVFGLVVVAALVVGDGSKQRAFAPAAALYLLFALPALVLVREPRRERPHARTRALVRAALGDLATSWREAQRYPAVTRFLVGRFLYSDAIATLSAFLTVYMTRLGGFSEQQKNLALGLSVVAAAAAALVAGRFVERFGPRRPLVAVLPVMAACVLASAAIGSGWTIWVLSPAVGAGLGVVWTADRVFMLHLTPAPLRGQFFAFFNLANRAASAVGPLVLWSGVVWVLHERSDTLSALGASRVAVGVLALAALVGWFVIRPLRDDPE